MDVVARSEELYFPDYLAFFQSLALHWESWDANLTLSMSKMS